MCQINVHEKYGTFFSMLFIMKLNWAFANSNKCINLLDSITVFSITKAQKKKLGMKKNVLVILNLI